MLHFYKYPILVYQIKSKFRFKNWPAKPLIFSEEGGKLIYILISKKRILHLSSSVQSLAKKYLAFWDKMNASFKQNSVPLLEQKNILKYGVPTSEKQRAKTLPIMTKTLSNQSFSPLIALLMARSITPKNLALQRRENRPKFPNILLNCLRV